MSNSNNKTSVFSNSMIWFGAAVSIAEIATGTYLASLGMKKGILAIVLGHLIGGVLFFLAGLIGGKEEKSAMDTTKMAFGEKGSYLFSSLNVLQLVGWTAIMIVYGATAANTLSKSLWSIDKTWLWSIVIGGLIILWIVLGIKNIGKINYIVITALFALTIVLSVIIFKGDVVPVAEDGMTFGAAVELSVAMPLSWLPLVSDYTRNAKKPVATTISSTLVYSLISIWMYIIGMAAVIYTGKYDISEILLEAGLGIAAVGIVIISTVTTTFLDAYSAGVSTESITKKLKEKPVGVIVCIIGILLAIFTDILNFEKFLYIIGSVFAPMIAVLIADYYILKNKEIRGSFNWINLIVWLIGFIIYRLFMKIDIVVGYTLPVMVITVAITVISNVIYNKIRVSKSI